MLSLAARTASGGFSAPLPPGLNPAACLLPIHSCAFGSARAHPGPALSLRSPPRSRSVPPRSPLFEARSSCQFLRPRFGRPARCSSKLVAQAGHFSPCPAPCQAGLQGTSPGGISCPFSLQWLSPTPSSLPPRPVLMLFTGPQPPSRPPVPQPHLQQLRPGVILVSASPPPTREFED